MLGPCWWQVGGKVAWGYRVLFVFSDAAQGRTENKTFLTPYASCLHAYRQLWAFIPSRISQPSSSACHLHSVCWARSLGLLAYCLAAWLLGSPCSARTAQRIRPFRRRSKQTPTRSRQQTTNARAGGPAASGFPGLATQHKSNYQQSARSRCSPARTVAKGAILSHRPYQLGVVHTYYVVEHRRISDSYEVFASDPFDPINANATTRSIC